MVTCIPGLRDGTFVVVSDQIAYVGKKHNTKDGQKISLVDHV